MKQVLDLYERLSSATDDRTRARVIADAFAALEQRYPQMSEMATQSGPTETDLNLVKEIEEVKHQTERVRAELKETELKLTKEIEQVRTAVERSRANILLWSFGFWITQMVAIGGILWRLTSGP